MFLIKAEGEDKLNKVYEKNFEIGKIYGGLEFFTYQLAFGASIRYLDCLESVMVRLYLGPFKLWLNLRI